MILELIVVLDDVFRKVGVCKDSLINVIKGGFVNFKEIIFFIGFKVIFGGFVVFKGESVFNEVFFLVLLSVSLECECEVFLIEN